MHEDNVHIKNLHCCKSGHKNAIQIKTSELNLPTSKEAYKTSSSRTNPVKFKFNEIVLDSSKRDGDIFDLKYLTFLCFRNLSPGGPELDLSFSHSGMCPCVLDSLVPFVLP